MIRSSSCRGTFIGHSADLTSIPRPAQLWRSLSFWISSAFALLLLAAVPTLVVDYWFLDSLARSNIFWTNFSIQCSLFLAGVCLFGVTISLLLRSYSSSRSLHKAGVHLGLWIGIFSGWRWSTHYEEYLLALNGGSFGTLDPLFGHDYWFYVFTLPAIETTLFYLTCLSLIGAACAIAARFDELLSRGIFNGEAWRLGERLGLLVTNGLNVSLFLLGTSLVARTFLSRYGLLFNYNAAAGVRTGAAYLDVEGLFSNLKHHLRVDSRRALGDGDRGLQPLPHQAALRWAPLD